jgi:hypothetical protein
MQPDFTAWIQPVSTGVNAAANGHQDSVNLVGFFFTAAAWLGVHTKRTPGFCLQLQNYSWCMPSKISDFVFCYCGILPESGKIEVMFSICESYV